jgi:hypothetical protein
MPVAGFELLSVPRVSRIMQALEDTRTLPQELKFVQRTPFVPAAEGEIVGRWINRVQIADLVADDARALTYAAGRVQLEQTTVPNIKHGRQLTQENLNELQNLDAALAGVDVREMGNNEIVGNVLPSIVDDIRLGIYQRCEALLVAMHLDTWTYNRFGITVQGTWGIPADLKVTPQIPWTDHVNADPVNDVWVLKRNATVRYGGSFNRMTMSTTAFIQMISCANFQEKARTTLPLFINLANLPAANIEQQMTIAENVLGCQVELYDARFWSQDSAGNLTSAPYLPINRVIFSDTANDNNPAVQDFANGITTESRLAGLLPNTGSAVLGNFAPGMRGPLAYTTVNSDLNPPNVTIWGVMRGFPRRFRLQASAVMTIGNFTDAIPITEPFAA